MGRVVYMTSYEDDHINAFQAIYRDCVAHVKVIKETNQKFFVDPCYATGNRKTIDKILLGRWVFRERCEAVAEVNAQCGTKYE